MVRAAFTLVAVVAAAGPAAGGPVIVSFEYTFATGEAVRGTAAGNLRADLTTVDLTAIDAYYTGRPEVRLTHLVLGDYSGPPRVLRLDGEPGFRFYGFEADPDVVVSTTYPNFGFYLDTSGAFVNSATVGTFATAYFGIGFPFDDRQREAERFDRTRFRAAVIGGPAVPEPATVAVTGLLTAGGWVVRRRGRR